VAWPISSRRYSSTPAECSSTAYTLDSARQALTVLERVRVLPHRAGEHPAEIDDQSSKTYVISQHASDPENTVARRRSHLRTGRSRATRTP
jgi:hypothetical protein